MLRLVGFRLDLKQWDNCQPDSETLGDDHRIPGSRNSFIISNQPLDFLVNIFQTASPTFYSCEDYILPYFLFWFPARRIQWHFVADPQRRR